MNTLRVPNPSARPKGPPLNVSDLAVAGQVVGKTTEWDRNFYVAPKPIWDRGGVFGPIQLSQGVMPLKPAPWMTRRQAIPWTDPLEGLQPQFGYARGQPKGLAYSWQKPTSGRITKPTSSLYSFLPSSL